MIVKCIMYKKLQNILIVSSSIFKFFFLQPYCILHTIGANFIGAMGTIALVHFFSGQIYHFAPLHCEQKLTNFIYLYNYG